MLPVGFLHHVSICVTDIRRAREFYGRTLGLSELPRPDLGFPGAWYALGDGHELHLIVHDDSKTLRGTTEIDGRDGHFAIRVTDLDATVAHLRASGVPYDERRRNATPWAQVYITDPDGNVIEFNVVRG